MDNGSHCESAEFILLTVFLLALSLWSDIPVIQVYLAVREGFQSSEYDDD
ncbi:hypothetical protein ID853_15510 [Xenorhabdus sp. Vera]|nr:hypothetical protein [Xenorhabdus sp. Vera]MBD2812253.1 hypothetical protein [Xenorhabdus sp. Vera]